jgi:hypothetical protein
VLVEGRESARVEWLRESPESEDRILGGELNEWAEDYNQMRPLARKPRGELKMTEELFESVVGEGKLFVGDGSMESGERMELVLLAQLKLGETDSAEFGCWPQALERAEKLRRTRAQNCGQSGGRGFLMDRRG